jgi:hypothetical protein
VVVEAPVLECHERLDQAGVEFRQRHPSPQLALGDPHGAGGIPWSARSNAGTAGGASSGRHGPEAPQQERASADRRHRPDPQPLRPLTAFAVIERPLSERRGPPGCTLRRAWGPRRPAWWHARGSWSCTCPAKKCGTTHPVVRSRDVKRRPPPGVPAAIVPAEPHRPWF